MEAENRKKPKLVWVISLYYFFSGIYTLYSFYLVLSGGIELAPKMQAYLESLTVFDYASSIVTGIVAVCAAVFLFFLRKISFYLFCFQALLVFLLTIWAALTTGWLSAVLSAGVGGLIGALIGILIPVIVCIYVWKLLQKGILR